MDTIEFNGKQYPKFQSEGNAARWILPYAKHFCKGDGVDIGANTKAWALPGAHVIDPIFDDQHAMSFVGDNLDYIFSSHCLEHVKENWYNVLDYWLTKIKEGGIIFLYLPHKSQEYWLPENNRKHIHSFDGSEIAAYLTSLGHQVFLSGVDLNNAFVLVCEKKYDTVKAKVHPNAGDTEINMPSRCGFVGGCSAIIKGEDLQFQLKRATNITRLAETPYESIEVEKISDDCFLYNGKAYRAE